MTNLRLGCNWPADKREKQIPLKALLTAGIAFPDSFDAEVELIGKEFPSRMWLNDAYGDCVIAAQANLTRVLEFIEQGFIVNITDHEVKDEYFEQNGGQDNGLFMRAAMEHWQNVGWEITGTALPPKNKVITRGCWHKPTPPNPVKRHLNIHAFAEVYTPDDLRECIFALHGCQIAVMLTEKDMAQFRGHERWHLTGEDGEQVGGHCVNVPAYKYGKVFECWTWGKRQEFDEDWYMKRQYDAYGIVDDRDNFMGNSPVDPEKLEAILKEITR